MKTIISCTSYTKLRDYKHRHKIAVGLHNYFKGHIVYPQPLYYTWKDLKYEVHFSYWSLFSPQYLHKKPSCR